MAIRYLSGINVDSNTLFVDDANNRVGIGTVSPSVPLHVIGNVLFTGRLDFTNGNVHIQRNGNELYLAAYSGWRFYDMQGNSTRMFLSQTGSLGIGTTAPQVKLEVRGAQNNTVAPANAVAKFVGNDAGVFVGNLAGTPNYGAWIQAMRESDALVFPLHLQPTGGNVGIGTTSPTQKLEVNGNILFSTRANSLIFGSTGADGTWGAPVITRIGSQIIMSDYSGVQFGGYDGSAYGARMTVLGTGNVGIGTTSPSEKLHVSGKILQNNGGSLYLDANATNTILASVGARDVVFEVNSANRLIIGSTGTIRLNNYGSGSKTGTVAYNLAVDSSGNIIETAGGVVDGSGTANYVSKWSDANTLTNSVIYENGGNIGIGVTNADYPLTVGSINVGGAGASLGVVINSIISTAIPASSVKAIIGATNSGFGYAAGSLLIQPRTGVNAVFALATEGTEKLRVTHDGNVGIGTTSPATKLHVVGNGLITGTLEVDTVNNGSGDFLTRTSGGIVTRRTAAEVRSDIQASQYFTVSSNSWIPALTSGWFRLASTSGSQRGSVRVILSFIGGNFAPQNYIIDVTKDWTTVASLRVDIRAAQTRWITGVRVIQDTVDTNVYHLEANFASSSNPYEFRLTFDNAYGFNSTWTMATTAPLVASTNGTVILSKDIFFSGNYSTDLINTGNINISGNTLSSIDTNGNIILSPNGSGNVGIGTTSPGAKLDVNGTTYLRSVALDGISGYSGNNIQFTNTGNTTFTGNVGIGTTSPNGRLHVYGGRLVLDNAANAQTAIQINSAGTEKIVIYRPTSTEDLRIYTPAAGDAFSLTQAGNVGIGTTSPTSKLHVASGNIEIDNGYYLRSRTSGGSNLFNLIGMSSDSIFVGGWEGNYMANLHLRGGNGYVVADFSQGNSSYFAVRGVSGTTPSEYMRVTSSGNVGIGTTSPLARLHTVASGTYSTSTFNGSIVVESAIPADGAYGAGIILTAGRGALANGGAAISSFYDTGDNDRAGLAFFYHNATFADPRTEGFRLTAQGNVGIGTTSPQARLDLGTGTGGYSLYQIDGKHALVTNGFVVGTEYHYGVGTIYGYNYANFNGYNINAVANVPLILHTNNTERMRINSSGNVGIGTTSPDIYSFGGGRILTVSSTSTYSVLVLSSGNANSGGISMGNQTIRRAAIDHLDGSHLAFYTNGTNSGTTVSERMRITSGGNVGIGITSPLALLDIAKTTGASLLVRNGDDSIGSNNRVQIRFSFNGTNNYSHFITSRHNSGAVDGNALDFYVGDTTSGGTYPTNAIHNLTLNGGNVGIGTTAPSQKLEVAGNIKSNHIYAETYRSSRTDGDIYIQAATANDFVSIGTEGGNNNLLTVLGSGNVGIGTTAPIAKLDVNGAQIIRSTAGFGTDSAQAALYISNTSDYGISGNFGGYSRNLIKSNGVGTLVVGQTTTVLIGELSLQSGNSGIVTLYAGGSERMRITSAGNVGIGRTPIAAALEVEGQIRVTGTSGYTFNAGGDTDGGMFSTADGTINFRTNGSERIRIDSSGNVGIGTTAPQAGKRLDVRSDASIAGSNAIAGYGYNDSGTAILGNGYATSGTGTNYGIRGISTGPRAGGVNVGGYFEAVSAGTNYALITGAGNVGIGTASPSQKLHVSGNIRVTGAYYDSNNEAGTSGQVLTSTGTGTDWKSLAEITGVDGTGTANYVAKWSDADSITNSQIQDNGTTVGVGVAPASAKLTVNGSITAAGQTSYGKSYGSLDTTGVAVAGLNSSSNGQSALFTFTCYGGDNHYQRVVYSCKNDSGIWIASKVVDEGTNGLDVTASANGATITFTYKSRSGTQGYSPRVLIEHLGSAFNTSYL